MNPELAGILRHILTVAGTALVAKGYVDSGQLELIVGAVVTVLSVALSVFSKRKSPAVL